MISLKISRRPVQRKIQHDRHHHGQRPGRRRHGPGEIHPVVVGGGKHFLDESGPGLPYPRELAAPGSLDREVLERPVTDDLVPALKRGIEIVKKGEPALIDVVTQPR